MKRLCSRRVSSQSQECQPESVSACAIVDHLRRNLEQQTGIVIDYLLAIRLNSDILWAFIGLLFGGAR